MKVALVHDYLREYGGAERVLEALHEIWPEAPVYTLVYLPEFLGPHRKRVEKWDIRPIIFSRTPFLSKITSLLRLLAPLLFARLDLSGYDIVIVSATGAYNPNFVKTKPGVHFCYCHTPPHYLYGYPTAREWKKYWWVRVPAEIANHFLRLLDFQSAQKVDHFIANSKNIAQRIEKFYRRETAVIYPPVDIAAGPAARYPHPTSSLTLRALDGGPPLVSPAATNKDGYFLTGGRLARAKRIDLAVKACTKLGLPLKVFGRMFAGYGEELKRMAACPPKSAGRRWRPTVEFLGEVSDEQLAQLYAGCRALIFPTEDEDFGIVPVEAMSFGRPVIAFRSGGVVETVIDGKTGLFFDEPTVESLTAAIKRFSDLPAGKAGLAIKEDDCIRQARKFSKERFKKEIREFVESKWQKSRSL